MGSGFSVESEYLQNILFQHFQRWFILLYFSFKERIRVKSLAYDNRAKEIREKLAKIEELEQERFSKKSEKEAVVQEHSRYDSDSDKSQKPKSGEEKYEQNYSISASYGEFALRFSSEMLSETSKNIFKARNFLPTFLL